MAHDVRLQQGEIVVDDRSIPLVSGEFHFWRVQRSNWEAILETVEDWRLPMLATYVAWNYHELEPGLFDFEGRTCPERDLKGFLAMTRERNIPLIMRPGPFIYAEWPQGGPPERAAGLHRLDERFLEMSREYINAVCDVMRPFLATNGGHIVLVQVDNEPWPDLQSRTEEMGAAGGAGLFADWLKERYGGDLDELNRCWQTRYTDFSDAAIFYEECYINRSKPLNGRLLPWRKYRRRILDGHAFVQFYANEIIRRGAAMYREAGIDVPLYMNGWHAYAQNFRMAMQEVDLAGVDGLHRHSLYFEQDGAEFEDEYQHYLEYAKMTVHDTGIGYAAEMGIGHPTGRISSALTFAPKPDNNLFDYLLYMANGIRCWNWYTLVARDGWDCTAIDQFGRPTPYADPITTTLKVVEAVRPGQMTALHNCGLITHKGHRFTESGNWDRVWNALLDADLDAALVDPEYGELDKALLFYGGADWLPREALNRLDRYVRDGGTLAFFSHTPSMDENDEPCNPFGLQEPDMLRQVNMPIEVVCEDVATSILKGGHCNKLHVCAFRDLPDDCTPIRLPLSTSARDPLVDRGLDTSERKDVCIGYMKPVGKGRIIHLGINPHGKLIELVRRLSETPALIQNDTRKVLTHVWRHCEGGVVVFAVNLTAQGRYTRVRLDRDALSLKGDSYELHHVVDDQYETLSAADLENITLYLEAHQVRVGILRGKRS